MAFEMSTSSVILSILIVLYPGYLLAAGRYCSDKDIIDEGQLK